MVGLRTIISPTILSTNLVGEIIVKSPYMNYRPFGGVHRPGREAPSGVHNMQPEHPQAAAGRREGERVYYYCYLLLLLPITITITITIIINYC